MDQIKIGKFIAEMRKSQSLTQKQLAEKLNISDKAVSKWECGKSMPDNAILLNLCEALNINVNELLSGERLSHEDYHGKAEENMMNLINESNKKNSVGIWTPIIAFLGLILLLYVSIVSINGSIYWFFDVPSLISIISFTAIIMIISGSVKDFLLSYKLCYGKNTETTHEQLVCSYAAWKLTFIAILISGAISSIMAIITILAYRTEPKTLGPNIAVAVLTLLYSLIIDLFLLPNGKILYTKLHKK